MRAGIIEAGDGRRVVVDDGNRRRLLPFDDLGRLVGIPRDTWLSEVDGPSQLPPWQLPLRHPPKILCAGLNYRSHAEEVGRSLPEYPTFFSKYPSSLVGPTDEIMLPNGTSLADWEAELALVISRPLYRADEQEARAAILGYMVLNDISMRDWQHRSSQWLQGKTFPSTTPLGPVLVTADELDPTDGLEVECRVDGKVVQRSSTVEMVFSPSFLVSYASHFVMLEPGDVVATGTPAGVGAASPDFSGLRSGQEILTRIEGIGEMVNRCVEATASAVGLASQRAT